ncbi:MAG: hypothetical protein P1V20_20560 [Verrucomicrobiales bacterium]|nr:hypothetical protein [Verrucomicrobiales bacterium]
MKSNPFHTLWILAVVDFLLIFAVPAVPAVAFAVHILLVSAYFVVLLRYTDLVQKGGRVTFLGFSLLLCILAPFAGLLGVGVLLYKTGSGGKYTHDISGLVVGNPLRECSGGRLPPVEFPILTSLGRENYEGLEKSVGFVKDCYNESAVNLLKKIRDDSNALSSLHAGAAVSVLAGQGEEMLSGAQPGNGHHNVDTNYRMGSVYQIQAMSGTVTSEEKLRLLQKAIQSFSECPDDQASVIGLAECFVALEDVERGSAIRSELDESDSVSREKIRELCALTGDWQTLQLSAERESDHVFGLEFWKGSRRR